MTKPTFDTHDPNNFIEFTLFRNYNLKPIVNEIIKNDNLRKIIIHLYILTIMKSFELSNQNIQIDKSKI